MSPADAAGVRGTDRGRRDAAPAFTHGDQPQGLAHILRSIRDVGERKRGRARDFGAPLKACVQEARARWHRHREAPGADGKIEAEALQAELTSQRRDRRLQERDTQRRLNALGGHHDRGHVRCFVTDPREEPPNHRAEVRSVDQKPSFTLGGLVRRRTGRNSCQPENSCRVSVQFRSPLVRG